MIRSAKGRAGVWVLRVLAAAALGVPAPAASEVPLSGEAGPPGHALVLWYRAPATTWMTSALPVGNGRLGAMVFGGVAQDRLQLNEKTLWTGTATSAGSYQSLGDLYLDFPGLTAATGYRRELDLEEAVARVTYAVGATSFTREVLASNPDGVLAVRLAASAPGQVSVDVRLVDAHGGATAVSGSGATIAGTLTLVSYEAQVRVVNEGGTLTGGPGAISVRNADAVTILLAAATDYDASKTSYRGAAPHAAVAAQVDAASAKGFAALRASHVADHRRLFDRVSLDLGQAKPSVPTPELLARYGAGARDPFVEVLFFQYGRYLTIASSRGLGLPANLQGIWNDSNAPPWQSDYHSDINVQMNYWPTDATNLAECFAPYSDWIATQALTREAWRANASAKGRPGFSLYTQCNPFGFSDWEYNDEANAWFGVALWDHYRFTQDAAYLRATAYPVMKSACEYWLSTLVADADGKLVAPDAWSPEHGAPYRERGTTYAQTLVSLLFAKTIEASRVLGADATFRATLEAKLAQLDPGRRLGARVISGGVDQGPLLREWKVQDDRLGEQHRHISHLVGLYPGDAISPLLDATWANAARASLVDRGDAGTGWSRAWKINTWARLLDGNHAKVLLENALHLTTFTGLDMSGATGGVYENLLDAHPPFQIDGNFGATAGIAEMLLQSHLDRVHLLPALPDAWRKGTVKGLVARGGFTVDVAWEDGLAKDVTVASSAGSPCTVKSRSFALPGDLAVVRPDGSAVAHTRAGDTLTFATRAGERYRIAPPSALPDPSASGSSGGGSGASSGGGSGASSGGGSGGSTSSSGASSSGASSSGASSSGASSGGASSGGTSSGGTSSGAASSGGDAPRTAVTTGSCASGGGAAGALAILVPAALLLARRARPRGAGAARRTP